MKSPTRPKISIFIPTYNRSSYVRYAIASVLRQDISEIEILVYDDASTDDTQEVVTGMRDRRIRYFRNLKNKGFSHNFRCALSEAKGTYIFLLGDDDLILRSHTLSALIQEMDHTDAGVGSMSILFYDRDRLLPSYKITASVQKIFLPPSPTNILKTKDWHWGFMSGNMYRRSLLSTNDYEEDLWVAHLKPLYRLLNQNGAVYLPNHYILGKISTDGNINNLSIKTNKGYHLHRQLALYKELDPDKNRFHIFKTFHIQGVIQSLPGIAYVTSKKNMKEIVKEIVAIDPSVNSQFSFWIFYMISSLVPNSVLGYIRTIRLEIQKQSLSNFSNSLHIAQHLKEIDKLMHTFS